MVSGRKTGSRAGLFREMLSSDIRKVKNLALLAICEALRDTDGMNQAARSLGIEKSCFSRLFREHQSDIDGFMVEMLNRAAADAEFLETTFMKKTRRKAKK
tara:strand:+ start:2694 stop:2996 length:303 start_codon:yes stop_codon:yes gene_type:complete